MASPTLDHSHILEAALNYAASGIAVFPCDRDKAPLVEHG